LRTYSGVTGKLLRMQAQESQMGLPTPMLSRVGATGIAYSGVTAKLMRMRTQDLSLEIVREVFSKNLTRIPVLPLILQASDHQFLGLMALARESASLAQLNQVCGSQKVQRCLSVYFLLFYLQYPVHAGR
jgi:hypothetical protein